MLKARGYRVLDAEDGPSAVRLVDGFDSAIDLVLTDLVMPGMHGYEVADELRRRFPGIHVVYTSGYTEDSALRQRLQQQPSAFLQKPFTPRQLCSTIRSALDAEHPPADATP